jgi:HK97 family phage portal protein
LGIKNIIKNLINNETAETEKESNVTTPSKWFVNWINGGETSSGEVVNEETAMKMAAVYACIRLLSQSVAKLPLHVYNNKGGKKIKDERHAVTQLLETRPNPYMTPFDFKMTMEAHRQLYGNAYAEIQFGRDGYPKGLWILNPELTEVVTDDKNHGRVWYTTVLPDGQSVKLKYENVLHIKNIGLTGLKGMSPIAVARETIGSQMASQKYVSKFYKNGTTAKGVLSVPGVTLKPEAKKIVREEWEKMNTGMTNANRIAILDSGITYQDLTMSQADAQFIETQKLNTTDIARIYNVPPHMIADLEHATFSNIEHQSISFVKNTLQPLLVSWEQALNFQLFTPTEQKNYYCKYNVDSELRGDSKSRAEYYEIMERIGAYNIDEIRDKEDLPALEDGLGKKHLISLNYTFLDKLEEYQMSKGQSNNKEPTDSNQEAENNENKEEVKEVQEDE